MIPVSWFCVDVVFLNDYRILNIVDTNVEVGLPFNHHPNKLKKNMKKITLIVFTAILLFSCKENPKPYTAAQLSEIQYTTAPKFIPNSEDILYINDASGNLELWQLSASRKVKKITDLKQNIRNLKVAPDGSFAIFAVDQGGD